jgi:sugar lactone lactonase YvrE
MQAIKFIFTCLILFVVLVINVNAQSAGDIAKSRELENKAAANYKAGEYPAYLSNLQRASDLRPNHPRLLYNLAGAYALNGKTDESIALIRRIVTMGLYFPFEKDDDFKSLGQQKIDYVRSLAEVNKRAVNASTRAFTLPDKEFIPEGIAYDPVNGRFFVGSIHKGKIVSIAKNGTVSDFSSAGDGLWSVSGMKVDAGRRILWASTTAFPQMEGLRASDEGKAGVFKYDLETGKLLNKYLLPNTPEKHALGDLTIDKTGRIYATDSVAPVIYTVPPGGNSLEVFLRDPVFSSLQGLTFTRDEKILFVADYSKGIFRIDLPSKAITQIKPSQYVTLLGIDGLYFHGDTLIAIQNGVNPQRVIVIGLNRDKTEALATKTLEANHADFFEPTLGVLVGNNFYYVANSQWPLVSEKGVLTAEKLREPVVLKLDLASRRN